MHALAVCGNIRGDFRARNAGTDAYDLEISQMCFDQIGLQIHSFGNTTTIFGTFLSNFELEDPLWPRSDSKHGLISLSKFVGYCK